MLRRVLSAIGSVEAALDALEGRMGADDALDHLADAMTDTVRALTLSRPKDPWVKVLQQVPQAIARDRERIAIREHPKGDEIHSRGLLIDAEWSI